MWITSLQRLMERWRKFEVLRRDGRAGPEAHLRLPTIMVAGGHGGQCLANGDGEQLPCCYGLGMDRDVDDFEELPAWRYYIYPIAGALGVLVLIGIRIAFG